MSGVGGRPRAAAGTPSRARPFISPFAQYIQEGVCLLAPVPQNFQCFEKPGRVPNLKNECLLPTVFAAFEAAHIRTPPWALRGAWSLLPRGVPPANQDTAAPVLISEPVSVFKGMNKTSGQETFRGVPSADRPGEDWPAPGENCL